MTEKKSKRFRLLPCAVAFAALGLATMPFLAGPPEGKMPEWVRFLGCFHPVILHLPIGVFLLILLQETGAMLSRKEPPGRFPLFFGAVSAVLAAIAGFLLYQGGGGEYAGNDTATRHLWGGIVFAIAAIFTYLAKCRAVSGGSALWYRLLLFGTVAIMAIASHDGGSLTHGEGFLTRHAPPFLKKLLGEKLPPASSSAGRSAPADPVVFRDVIMPIMERHCVSCHKEGKAKGKLRVDNYEVLMKGGLDGTCVEPGKSSESLFIERMELPLEDDDRMPPKGKPQPLDAELRVLKWWIDAGASPDRKLSESNAPDAIKTDIVSLSGLEMPSHEDEEEEEEEEVAASGKNETAGSRESLVAALAKEFPGSVALETGGGVVFSAAGMRDVLDDGVFGKFAPLIPHLTSADFSGTRVTDASVARLSRAGNLRVLRLAETAVTDAALDALSGLSALESLNLYGTKITDASLAKLSPLAKLRHLYVWQTAVTPAAVSSLKTKLPECEIVTGAR